MKQLSRNLPGWRLPAWFAAALLLGPAPAPAQTALEALNYQDCLQAVRQNPEKGFAEAQIWMGTGGGLPAQHCAALALFELRHYGDAADRLEALLPVVERQAPHLLTEILSQAANAWLLDGQAVRAKSLLDIAIRSRPDLVELRLDRAQAMAELGQYPGALADLDQALKLDPARDDALAMRAAARRMTGELTGARDDAEAALGLNPRNAEALLERGILRRLAGDLRGARTDLLNVRMLAPETPAAEAAGRQIEEIDVKR
jgi:tetratricopeptide (TPR) repeat protein